MFIPVIAMLFHVVLPMEIARMAMSRALCLTIINIAVQLIFVIQLLYVKQIFSF